MCEENKKASIREGVKHTSPMDAVVRLQIAVDLTCLLIEPCVGSRRRLQVEWSAACFCLATVIATAMPIIHSANMAHNFMELSAAYAPMQRALKNECAPNRDITTELSARCLCIIHSPDG
jgi:hypothetical protein